jgi:hypothetical protein
MHLFDSLCCGGSGKCAREVWRALEQAHLKTTVSNFPGALNYEVTKLIKLIKGREPHTVALEKSFSQFETLGQL